jgi:hypothetical protein
VPHSVFRRIPPIMHVDPPQLTACSSNLLFPTAFRSHSFLHRINPQRWKTTERCAKTKLWSLTVRESVSIDVDLLKRILEDGACIMDEGLMAVESRREDSTRERSRSRERRHRDRDDDRHRSVSLISMWSVRERRRGGRKRTRGKGTAPVFLPSVATSRHSSFVRTSIVELINFVLVFVLVHNLTISVVTPTLVPALLNVNVNVVTVVTVQDPTTRDPALGLVNEDLTTLALILTDDHLPVVRRACCTEEEGLVLLVKNGRNPSEDR